MFPVVLAFLDLSSLFNSQRSMLLSQHIRRDSKISVNTKTISNSNF